MTDPSYCEALQEGERLGPLHLPPDEQVRTSLNFHLNAVGKVFSPFCAGAVAFDDSTFENLRFQMTS